MADSANDPARTIVVIGGVAGGASAAARARRMNERARIILLEKDEHVSFANCGLPYYVGGEIEQREKLLVATPQRFEQFFRIEVRTLHEATAIDRERQVVRVHDRQKQTDYDQPYDRLVLAPGAEPIIPPIDGVNASNVFRIRNVHDAVSARQFIEERQPRRAVVVGAGYIGLEMVEMLRHRQLEVALVEMLEQVMPLLDEEMADLVEEELRRNGVQLQLGNALQSLKLEGDRVAGVILQDGTTIPADLVVMAIGVKPKTELARDAGLDIGPAGGISVNPFMQTSDPLIYAAGDAVEYEHAVTGTRMRIPLAGPANRAGRIAGEHAATDSAPAMRPVLGTSILRVFSRTVAMTGVSEALAKRCDIPCKAVWVPANHHVTYYPGAEEMMIKLLYDPSDGRVLGAQIVGGAGVDKRVDVIATAISLGGTIDDLAGLDLTYAPPYGAAKDPVHMAAFVAQNEMRQLELQYPPAYEGTLPAGTQLLDVRFDHEWKAGHLEDANHIPLPQLRERLDELDRERPVMTICRGGQRSYYATRLLRQSGFSEVGTLSGGMVMQQTRKAGVKA
jgi:NADPH-dependent 2,4-dienoyl-CoA reductase/sulfur reductase-like enzyme/rhodanese-related sulfurtransferase